MQVTLNQLLTQRLFYVDREKLTLEVTTWQILPDNFIANLCDAGRVTSLQESSRSGSAEGNRLPGTQTLKHIHGGFACIAEFFRVLRLAVVFSRYS